MRIVMRVVTITFVSNGRPKPLRPSGTKEGGATGEFGSMSDRRRRASLTHADTKTWSVSHQLAANVTRTYLGSQEKKQMER